MLSYLGSTDPELRDSFAYEIFANWLEQGLYEADYLRGYVLRLTVNLQQGLGDHESDSVFLRSFSALCLAEIVNHENKNPFLDRDEVYNLLTRTMDYLDSEQDPRGYVPEHGWAHALAHTADLLYVLVQNHHIGRDELASVLVGVQEKLVRPADWVNVHGEEDRLVRATAAALARNLIDIADLRIWLANFAAPAAGSWTASYEDERRQAAFFNTRSYLRSLFIRLNQTDDVQGKKELQDAILDALQGMRQF